MNTERPENGASGGRPENAGASGGQPGNLGAPGAASASGGHPESSGAPGAGSSPEAEAPNGAIAGEEQARDAGGGASDDARGTDAGGERRAAVPGTDGAAEAEGHGNADAADEGRALDAGASGAGRETHAEGEPPAQAPAADGAAEAEGHGNADAIGEGRALDAGASGARRETHAEGEPPAQAPAADGAAEAEGQGDAEAAGEGRASVPAAGDAGAGASDGDRGADAGDASVGAGSRGQGPGLGRGGRDGQGGRRRSPAVVASVAAAVLLVGGGGAYLAASASGGSDGSAAAGASGGSTPPPLRLDGATEGNASNGIAPGEPNPYGVRYRAGGDLPDGPGAAPVYRASGQVGADDVQRLAEALGVDGTPVTRGQTWHIGGKDGTGPTLQVDKQAPGAWTFQRFAAGTDDCRGIAGCTKTPPERAGDPPAEDAAKKAAAPVLKAAGQDEAKLDAGQVMGAQRVVHAEPVVDGLPTYGWTTGVTVNAQGEVVGGSGLLAAPVKGDSYPVLSAEKTLGLMNKTPGGGGRSGIGGCADPVPLKERSDAACDPSVTAKQDTVTVEKAVFGLAAHAVDGRQALVPSWLFQVRAQDARDRFTVTYPAVDPAFLAPPSEEPTTGPSPRPSGPKDDPSASPVTRNVTVEGYTAEGRDLTVTFTGGVCADYDVTASESGGTVTVRVTETTRPEKVCILIAKVFHRTVRLDAPLGDRRVVGTDGQGVPLEKPGARLPATPQTSGAR
ncbi:hypothetical protein [Streptomyces sp. SS1-1]|uniref:hypothetical protein n=1 Tax=Streptomyces sp. SS1-1 TaxID=2651869 RepID=UPI0029901E19|nr:hypothetical protein [Streptomyces sp. SS1-1]